MIGGTFEAKEDPSRDCGDADSSIQHSLTISRSLQSPCSSFRCTCKPLISFPICLDLSTDILHRPCRPCTLTNVLRQVEKATLHSVGLHCFDSPSGAIAAIPDGHPQTASAVYALFHQSLQLQCWALEQVISTASTLVSLTRLPSAFAITVLPRQRLDASSLRRHPRAAAPARRTCPPVTAYWKGTSHSIRTYATSTEDEKREHDRLRMAAHTPPGL